MTALIGRERELATGLGVVTTAQTTPVARTLVIEGPSGVGKTAFLEALHDASKGWVQASTAAYRIQSRLSSAVIRRLVSSLLEALGSVAPRYTSGLSAIEGSIEPGQMLLRLLEGITLDRPVFLSVDDAQWLDEESAHALATVTVTLADRALVIAYTERTDANARQHFTEPDERLVLTALADRAAAEVARAHYPEASDEVIDAIVHQSAGQPIDLVALSKSARDAGASTTDDIAANMRAVTVKSVQALPVKTREFLHLVSLLSEPIDYGLLRRLMPDESALLAQIATTSDRFLIQSGTELRFAHALVADAILETIPVKIPMRRRIISALQTSTDLSFEDRIQIAEQALACGDRQLAYDTLTKLMMHANERGLVPLTIDAAERLLAIGEPPDETFVQIYSGYARALNFIDIVDRAVEALAHAIDEAMRRNLSDIGLLASQYTIALWLNDKHDRAIAAYERFSKTLTSSADQLHLQAAAMWFALTDNDAEKLAEILHKLDSLGVSIPPDLALRREIVLAYAAVRSGDFQQANASIERVDDLARATTDALRNLSGFARAYVEFHLHGPIENRMTELVRKHADDDAGSYMQYIYANAELLAGRYDNVALAVNDALQRVSDPMGRRRMLGIAAGLSALTQQPSNHRASIEHDVHRLLTGESGVFFLPLASWCSMLTDTPPQRARVYRRNVLAWLEKPGEPLVIVPITPLAVGASLHKDFDALSTIVDGTIWEDKSPIVSADRQLARAIAMKSMKMSGADDALKAALDECTALHLVALCELAGRVTANVDTPQAQTAPKSPLTARERQIAAAIAEGRSNREIAESFVLSERTIEGHVSNIFNKLNVSSRTQIAAWFIKTA